MKIICGYFKVGFGLTLGYLTATKLVGYFETEAKKKEYRNEKMDF